MPTKKRVPKVSAVKDPAISATHPATKPPGPWLDIKDAPREKLLRKGVKHLSDSELLAIFLRVGYKDKNVMELAKELIDLKGLNWLLNANFKEFCSHKGLGQSHYVQLRAVMELGSRYLEDVMKRETLPMNSPSKVREYLCYKLGDSPREVFACVFMDNKNRVLEYKEIFSGTIDSANVYPREIITYALRVNAASMVIVHNHPSGCPRPSEADKRITILIKEACNLMNIQLLDHIIVSGSESFSFLEEDLLCSR